MDHSFATPVPSTNGFDAAGPAGGDLHQHLVEDELADDDVAEYLPEDDLAEPIVDDDLVSAVAGEPGVPGLDVDLDTLAGVEAELADVELALRRLDDGSYGRCEVCDAAIDDGRLAESPAARFCRAHLPITLA